MGKRINYDSHRQRIKGYYGMSGTPLYNTSVSGASPKQINYVQSIVRQLEQLGVEVSSTIKDDPPTTVVGINKALRELRELMAVNGIKDLTPVFVNICRSKDTGKKIRYKTTKRYHAPVGYEFIYELCTEFKCTRAVSS